MKGEYDSCRKLMHKLRHPLINCRTCSNIEKCQKEERKQEREFDRYDRMMRQAKDIRVE